MIVASIVLVVTQVTTTIAQAMLTSEMFVTRHQPPGRSNILLFIVVFLSMVWFARSTVRTGVSCSGYYFCEKKDVVETSQHTPRLPQSNT